MKYRLLILFFFNVVAVLGQVTSHTWANEEPMTYRLQISDLYDESILLYNSNDTNVVIASYKHKKEEDLYVTLEVLDSVSIGNWLRVIPRWNDGDTLAMEDGYIRLAPYIIVWPRHPAEINLYKSPNYKSQYYVVRSMQNYLSVQKFAKGWIYTSFIDQLGQQHEGWISPESQCPLTFTTCN